MIHRIGLACLLLLTIVTSSYSQIFKPVKWSFSQEKISDKEYYLVFSAKIDKGWTIYSQFTADDGPIPTTITFEESTGIELIGKASESGKKKEGMDALFGVNVIKFLADKPFVMKQKVKVKDASKKVTGYVTYMACDDEKCLPPTDEEFSFSFGGESTAAETTNKKEETTVNVPGIAVVTMPSDTAAMLTDAASTDTLVGSVTALGPKISGNKIDQKIPTLYETQKDPLSDCGGQKETREGLFWLFVFGFLGGLLALLTPCVFPMLPLTVSFFLKDTKRKGWVNGAIYGASIIVIYVLIGLLITILVGPEALNRLSTNWIANTLFFLIFVAFAFSFFGYYEITLPSSWSTKSDRMADKGGLLGIFFMAFTLALVSFSCTGPIIGTAIVQASTKGEFFGPFLVMLGFSTALALPFGLFAAFPAWLNTLPKSGSWMNSVKVVLGFLELALALKFLSVADMTNRWGFLKYELFMGLWVIIFIGMALYLFGLIKFPHDSPIKKLGTVRLAFAGLATAGVFYLLSGFFVNESTGNYKALSLMSGLAPPAHYNFFIPPQPLDASIKEKYPSYSKCANNINCFKDYFEGIQYANEVNKPILIDFTGHGCVNCRKTEEHIWIDDRVRNILMDSVVLISLYVDDDKKIEEVLISVNTNEKLRNIGKKWADFQIVNFEKNAQPLYVLASNNQKVVSQPRAYVPGVDGYLDYLRCSLSQFKNHPELIQ
jgi:thiol:disulfide interchange protein DsbD